MIGPVAGIPIQPLDAADPFCTCPHCGSLASHGVESRTLLPAATPRFRHGLQFRDQKYGYGFEVTYDDEATEPVAIRATRRTCVHCHHAWYTHAERAEPNG